MLLSHIPQQLRLERAYATHKNLSFQDMIILATKLKSWGHISYKLGTGRI